jgi:hypothetical protein
MTVYLLDNKADQPEVYKAVLLMVVVRHFH